MKIDADRLRTLRKRKLLTRQQLSERSRTADSQGINMRTIQRLENEPDECKTTREDTVMRLAKALDVEPGVLTGELPLPAPGEAPPSEPDPVRIGAQIPPKVRLAYDLIKRRYGVNATDVITMAPLFFALLAEGSLAWRREKLREARETASHLEGVGGFWSGGMSTGMDGIWHGINREKDSIRKADLFGECLVQDPDSILVDQWFFDSSEDNPFARYLHKLAADLNIPDVIQVDGGKLCFGSPVEFPDYNVSQDEVERITNGSAGARRALETGFARLLDIPEEIMGEDKDIERQQWLEDRLAPLYKGPEMDVLAQLTASSPDGDKLRNILRDVHPKTNTSDKNEKGDDQ